MVRIRNVSEHLPVHVEPAAFGWYVVEGQNKGYYGTSSAKTWWCLTLLGAQRRAKRRTAYFMRLQEVRERANA